MKNYYKIMLDFRNRVKYAADCLSQKFIGADYGIKTDLTSDLSLGVTMFIKKYTPEYLTSNPSKNEKAAELACTTLWTICNEIQKGDVVVCPNGRGVLYFGEVVSDYYYVPNDTLSHRRAVNWFGPTFKRKNITPGMAMSLLAAHKSLQITDHAAEMEKYITGTGAHDYNGKYFLVGAFWDSHNPQDMTELFVEEERWENGYDDKFISETKSVPEGSFIAIKSAYVRERAKSVMMIKARGRVLKNHGDGRNLDVEWEEDFSPFEVEFGGYLTTLKEVTNSDHIEAIWKNESETNNKPDMTNEMVTLLKYKRQIILQGPPGTGKTKLAKEIASELVGNDATNSGKMPMIDKATIENVLKDTASIKMKIGKELKIVAINDNNVEVKTDDSKVWSPSYNKIIESYKNKLFNESNRTGGFVPYSDAIAKFLFDRFPHSGYGNLSDNVKLIQFHPSYSYEDFVRGIIAESKGDKIEYKSINKILGKFATDAKKNLDDSRKDIGSISKENKIREYFDEFADHLSDRITEGETIGLTPRVNLIDVDDDAFRYKGSDGWSPLGNRMLFKDIIQAFLDGNKARQDIKKNKNLSGLAIQHASYFVRVLKMFQDYLVTKNLRFDNLSTEKQELKNYVLIIDEINRANLSSVLGELIYALEYRGENVESMYEVDGSNTLALPDNLYIIGTMNTADRSVGHIDYAIRRRFAFVDVMPEDLTDELGNKFHRELFDKVSAMFTINCSPEFEKKDVQLGHSYFIDKSDEGGSMAIRLQYEIKPILLEYVKDGILVGDNIKAEIENLQV